MSEGIDFRSKVAREQELMTPPEIPESEKITIEEIHIGAKYMLWSKDTGRYLNRGYTWYSLIYDWNSPRLHKMQELIEQGLIKRDETTPSVLANNALIQKYKAQCENSNDKKCLLLYTNWLREQGYL